MTTLTMVGAARTGATKAGKRTQLDVPKMMVWIAAVISCLAFWATVLWLLFA
jgi:hypothetical protein